MESAAGFNCVVATREGVTTFVAGTNAVETSATRQFVRGNGPATDLLAHADAVDADELVIGVRERTPTAKVVFGSTAQRVLLRSNRPMAVVPLEGV